MIFVLNKPFEYFNLYLTVNYNIMIPCKKILMVVFSFFIISSLFAQESDTKKEGSEEIQTVFNKKNISNGGYGAFSIGYSTIAGRNAMTTGFRGGWIANHQFVLGLAGSTFISEEILNQLPLVNSFLTGGYGGLLIEPLLFPQKPVHVSFPMIFGAGGVAQVDSQDWMGGHNNHDPMYYQMSHFFIFNPGVDLELNMARIFRMGVGLSYRLTSATDLLTYEAGMMRGWDFYLVFKFGKF